MRAKGYMHLLEDPLGFVGFNEFKDKNNCQIQLQYIKPTIMLYVLCYSVLIVVYTLWQLLR